MKLLVSYSQSPIYNILKTYLDDTFVVVDEKFNDFSQVNPEELWFDTYIDLYDPRLINYEYLYQFFARIHQICDETPGIPKKMLRNYTYTSSHKKLNQVFYLYHSFSDFFINGYEVLPIYIPDILNKEYHHHPYNQLKRNEYTEWEKSSLFRVIHQEDVVSHLYDLQHEACAFAGIKVSFGDLYDKIEQIFGKINSEIEDAYDISIKEPHKIKIISDTDYNLESILIDQLGDSPFPH